MLIRRAQPSDSPGICQAHVAAIRTLCATHYSAEQIEAWVAGKEPASYVVAIAERELFVALASDSVIGFGQLNPAICEIGAVYVAPAAARTGVGSALLAKLEEAARARGIRELHLNASLNAIAFYEAAGYRQQAEARHCLRNGIELTCMKMTKTLAA